MPWTRQATDAATIARRARARGVGLKPNGYLEYTVGPHKSRGVHVVAMEQHIGRRIEKGEQVHHIDGDKTNNNLSNLRLMDRSEHARLHAIERSPLRNRDAAGRYAGGAINAQ